VIDERDQADLNDREADKDDAGDDLLGGSIQHVKVTKRVCFFFFVRERSVSCLTRPT